MASRPKELLFLSNQGMKTYAPEIVSTEFQVSNLENVETVFARWKPVRAHKTEISLPGERIRAMAFIFGLTLQNLEFFAITDTKAFTLKLDSNNNFFLDQVGSAFDWTRLDPIAWVGWDEVGAGKVYFTKLGTNLQALNKNGLSEVTPTFDPGSGVQKLQARYMIVFQNRVILGNIKVGSNRYPRRVQWSDLYNPEDFEVTSGKEADLFELETGNLEITGIFSHRGYLTIFTKQSIWRASYVGYPRIFRFEPVFSDFGNIHHYAAISTKELIFFIGDDNFYMLQGFTPRPIGDEIWNFWQETKAVTSDDFVQAFTNPFQTEVMWKYRRKGRSDVGNPDIRIIYMPIYAALDFKTYLWMDYNGYYQGRPSWRAEVFLSTITIEFLRWNPSNSRWELRQEDGNLLQYLEDDNVDSGTTPWYYADGSVSLKDAATFSAINDYRAIEHDWLIVYNYKENRWSNRSADGIESLYNNRISVNVVQVIDDFHSGWDNDGKLSAPVYIDQYPWAKIDFSSMQRTGGIVTVNTTANHNLSTGDKINIVGCIPSAFNGEDIEITVVDSDTFTYTNPGSDEFPTAVGSTDFRSFDDQSQVAAFPETILVGRENDLALYQAGDFVDVKGEPLVTEIKSQEMFLESFNDSKEVGQIKFLYKKVGDPTVYLQVGYRNSTQEPLMWTDKKESSETTIEGELRFNFEFELRSKFYVFIFTVENSSDNYITSIQGGSISIPGLQRQTTEI